LGRAGAAFVPAIALARSRDDFVSKVTAKLDTYDFEIVEIKDIEPCRTRFRRCAVSEEVIALAASLTENNPVALHTFHAYEGE
jgi:peptidase E